MNNSNSGSSPSSPTTNSSSSYSNSSSIDKARVERLLSDISRNSSKSGDFSALKNYFIDTIFPHPSGQIRTRDNIGPKMEQSVRKFPKYEISKPYNISYVNSSFPLTVKCDMTAEWINTKNVPKKAIVHKTYYITSDYKVSRFRDVQENIY